MSQAAIGVDLFTFFETELFVNCKHCLATHSALSGALLPGGELATEQTRERLAHGILASYYRDIHVYIYIERGAHLAKWQALLDAFVDKTRSSSAHRRTGASTVGSLLERYIARAPHYLCLFSREGERASETVSLSLSVSVCLCLWGSLHAI